MHHMNVGLEGQPLRHRGPGRQTHPEIPVQRLHDDAGDQSLGVIEANECHMNRWERAVGAHEEPYIGELSAPYHTARAGRVFAKRNQNLPPIRIWF